jgi:hypothetical protein
VQLPSGYHAPFDSDVLVLRCADSSQVALFSSRGFVEETMEQAAWEDHEKSEGPSRYCASSEGRVTFGRIVVPYSPECGDSILRGSGESVSESALYCIHFMRWVVYASPETWKTTRRDTRS